MVKIVKGYTSFLNEVKERIHQAQYDAMRKVNQEHISVCWDIGKMIVEKQEKYGWGKSIVENLSSDLQKDMPAVIGYSSANLWRMRNFFLQYKGSEKLAPLVREISWSNNVVIFEKCKDEFEREFYIKLTKKYGWTKAVLIHQIENQSYQKYLLNQTNFEKTLPEKYKRQAILAVKDEYTLDFLELSDEHSERELEAAIVNNIRKMLIELGGYFTFIGNQYKLDIGGKEFFIDLLLYHRQLRCLVAVDLKIGEFKPEYAGKMQFYLSALNEQVKLEDENPSIGMIFCKEKNKIVVEYALRDATHPLGVVTYKISQTLPKNLKGLLPSQKDIQNKLKSLE
jgi:predicted nuclease of restriction endonuclease-like (RecB) superfamily